MLQGGALYKKKLYKILKSKKNYLYEDKQIFQKRLLNKTTITPKIRGVNHTPGYKRFRSIDRNLRLSLSLFNKPSSWNFIILTNTLYLIIFK